MEWSNLLELNEEELWRGAVFRFPAIYPFESVVDFMLFDNPYSDSGFSLICTTGCKSGLLKSNLSEEALAKGDVKAISKSWLIENWTKWVYSETKVSEVRIASAYPQEVGDKKNQKNDIDTSHLDLNI